MLSSKTKIINPDKIKEAEIVVGIPSLNEADNISFVVKQADKGLIRNFKGRNLSK